MHSVPGQSDHLRMGAKVTAVAVLLCAIRCIRKGKKTFTFAFKQSVITSAPTHTAAHQHITMPPKKTMKKVIQKTTLKPTTPAKDTSKKTG